jgi:hypothetical protein
MSQKTLSNKLKKGEKYPCEGISSSLSSGVICQMFTSWAQHTMTRPSAVMNYNTYKIAVHKSDRLAYYSFQRKLLKW